MRIPRESGTWNGLRSHNPLLDPTFHGYRKFRHAPHADVAFFAKMITKNYDVTMVRSFPRIDVKPAFGLLYYFPVSAFDGSCSLSFAISSSRKLESQLKRNLPSVMHYSSRKRNIETCGSRFPRKSDSPSLPGYHRYRLIRLTA